MQPSCYALHLLINQRVLYEVPAPTVTFYTLLGMAVTVSVAFLAFHPAIATQYNRVVAIIGISPDNLSCQVHVILWGETPGWFANLIVGFRRIIDNSHPCANFPARDA